MDTCTESDIMSSLIRDKDSRDFLDATGKVFLVEGQIVRLKFSINEKDCQKVSSA